MGEKYVEFYPDENSIYEAVLNAFYEKIDKSHRNWARVSTSQSRLSRYNKGRAFHKAWLHEVLNMNPANLEKNTIGLSSSETKKMAQEILDHWKE